MGTSTDRQQALARTAAPDLSRYRKPTPRTWSEKLMMAKHRGNRILGMLQAKGRFGAAGASSRLYTLLGWLGVMEQDPTTRHDPKSLELFPWGSRDIEAPPAQPPAGFDCMWPQSAVSHEDFPDAVLNLNRAEHRHHVLANATRYLGQILTLTPRAVWRCWFRQRINPVDDDRLNEIISATHFAQYLRPLADDADERAMFAADQEILVLDVVPVADVPTLDGLHVSACRGWFARVSDSEFAIQAIKVGEHTFRPTDGAAWSLARYYLLMGVNYHLLACQHGMLHFPYDAINAVSQMALPQGHILYQLIRPFTKYTLGINKAVLNHRRAVYHNSQREVFTPFAMESHTIRAVTALGYNGIEGNPYHRAYQYGRRDMVDSAYKRYLDDWYGAIRTLVAEVTTGIPHDDPYVKAWADHLCDRVPGFPSGAEIFDGDRLVDAVTFYIFTVSVHHSADHHTYGLLPTEDIPLRIRTPPPTPDTAAFNPSDLQTREDYFRHQLSCPMFFVLVNFEAIDEVRFDFMNPAYKQAVCRLRSEMVALDEKWADTSFPSSREIASSIQS